MKKLSIPISVFLLSFVDNSLFVSQEKSYEKLNAILYSGYNIVFSLFNKFGLVIEHNRSEIFYFSKSTKEANLSLLNLRSIKDAVIKPKNIVTEK